MVTGPPAPGTQPNPEQMAAMQKQMALEASKRGMTPQQFQQWQRQQIEADAKKAGLTFDQYVNQLKQQAFQNHQRQQQQQQQAQQQQAQQPPQQQQGQQVPINPGAPDPKAVAIAKWLRSQDLKPRTCILNGQRKDMFRGKTPPPQNNSSSSPPPSKPPTPHSQTRHPRPPIPRLRPRLLKAPLPPPPNNDPRQRRGNLQTPPPLPPRPPRLKSRPFTSSLPRRRPPTTTKTHQTHQRPLDRPHRATARRHSGSALCLAVRRAAVAHEAIRGRGADCNHGVGHVPAMADQGAHWGMVSQHGRVGLAGPIFRHGHFQTYSFLCDGLYGTARAVAVSEPF